MGGTRPFTEASRVAALIREWVDSGRSRMSIEQDTGVDQRTLYSIEKGERELVGFETLDKLLTGMQETYRYDEEFKDVMAALEAPTNGAASRSPSRRQVPSSRARATR